MTRINFDPYKIDWRPFFTQPQVGGAYFQGKPYMRGTGIGALFSSLYRFLLPIAKSVGKEVGREGLAVGSRILSDVAKGENAKSVINTHTREGIRNLVAKANDKLQKGSGQTKKKPAKKQKGRGTFAFIHLNHPHARSKNVAPVQVQVSPKEDVLTNILRLIKSEEVENDVNNLILLAPTNVFTTKNRRKFSLSWPFSTGSFHGKTKQRSNYQ